MASLPKLSVSFPRCDWNQVSNSRPNPVFSRRDPCRPRLIPPSPFLPSPITLSPYSHPKKTPKILGSNAFALHDEDLPDEEENAADLGLQDWREFRARLIQGSQEPGSSLEPTIGSDSPQSDARHSDSYTFDSTSNSKSWAHPLFSPEPGCLVIAHPGAFGARQQYFHQAVIFLYAHGDSGSAGVILNRPTEYTLGQLAGSESLLPEFSNCPLYMGGDVGENFTHVIHGVKDLPGSREIVSGVYVGGYSSIKDHVRSGKSKDTDYKWFARYAGWAPGQLEREVVAGVWFLGSCSKDLILKPCVNLEKPLWREVMELMGGEYASLSKRAYGEK